MLSGILPAVKNMKDFEKLLASDHEQIVFLETRLSQLGNLVQYTKKAGKKAIVHIDLVQGLKADEYGLEFLVREVKVDGIMSTRGNVIVLAKKHNIIAIQRLFIIDSHALDTNLKMIEKVKPDYIEVLPGLIPSVITQIAKSTQRPVIAGGLIQTVEDAENALAGGAVAVTTSNTELWALNDISRKK